MVVSHVGNLDRINKRDEQDGRERATRGRLAEMASGCCLSLAICWLVFVSRVRALTATAHSVYMRMWRFGPLGNAGKVRVLCVFHRWSVRPCACGERGRHYRW